MTGLLPSVLRLGSGRGAKMGAGGIRFFSFQKEQPPVRGALLPLALSSLYRADHAVVAGWSENWWREAVVIWEMFVG